MSSWIPVELVIKAFDPRRPVPEEEQHQRFHEILPWLSVRAHESAEIRAASWRNFRVGCALLAFKTSSAYSAAERWMVFAGSNIKITKESRTICAEQIAVSAAREAGYDRIIGMIIVGNPQPEEGSLKEYPTLHPCKECRRMFSGLSVVTGNTIIVTTLPGGKTLEVHTFEELLAAHGESYQQNGSIAS